jgi:hypothetical protein
MPGASESQGIGERAEDSERTVPDRPIEYERGVHSGPLSQFDVAPPLASGWHAESSVPQSREDIAMEQGLSQDFWSELESSFPPRSRRQAFSWRERDWNLGYWKRRLRATPALVASIAILLAALVLGFAVAGRFARGFQVHLPAAQAAPNGGTGVVVQPAPTQQTPTPTDTASDLGIWVSNPAPSTSGMVQVFVRMTSALQPDAHIPVSIYVQYAAYGVPMGPVTTNSYGLATFTLNYAGLPPGQPVFVTASAIVGGETLTGETSFVPA